MRRLALFSVLALVALTENHNPISFIQPKSRIVLSDPRGVDVLVQTKITPSDQNRWFRLEWPDGVSMKSLNGSDESAIQPEKPLKIRVFPGKTQIIASVFGSGQKLLGREILELSVCGGEEGCSPESKKPSK